MFISALSLASLADEFTDADMQKWYQEFMTVVTKGEALHHGGIGEKGVACDMCHPNGANTHPETYPKFQNQIGKVASLRDMINWCIENTAVQGKPLALDDPRMIALEAYLMFERRGVRLDPGKH